MAQEQAEARGLWVRFPLEEVKYLYNINFYFDFFALVSK